MRRGVLNGIGDFEKWGCAEERCTVPELEISRGSAFSALDSSRQ